MTPTHAPALPSHHDAEALDVLEIERLRILLLLSTIGRSEFVPFHTQRMPVRVCGGGDASSNGEVKFPGYSGLFTTVGLVGRREIVLADQSVFLVV